MKFRFLEVSPIMADKGNQIGKDPRQMSSDELGALGHPKRPIKAVRAKCLCCCNGSIAEVRKCTVSGCSLWPMRMGVNVFNKRFIDRKAEKAALDNNS